MLSLLIILAVGLASFVASDVEAPSFIQAIVFPGVFALSVLTFIVWLVVSFVVKPTLPATAKADPGTVTSDADSTMWIPSQDTYYNNANSDCVNSSGVGSDGGAVASDNDKDDAKDACNDSNDDDGDGSDAGNEGGADCSSDSGGGSAD